MSSNALHRSRTILLVSSTIAGLSCVALWAVWKARSGEAGRDGAVRQSRAVDARPAASQAVSDAALPHSRPEEASLPVPPPNSQPVLSQPRSPKELTALQAEVLDETVQERKRLDALNKLRYAGGDWKSAPILASMTRLLRTSTNEGNRINLCRYMRGADSPDFRQQLMTSACEDASSGVRREAAASLRPMASDPAVQMILKRALENERNAGVKSEIERTLLAGRR